MSGAARDDNDAFRQFLRRVWRDDVGPLLRDRRHDQRARTARTVGKYAGATGLFLDGLLNLKGRPFGRFMTVMGSSLGALLPDVWDWRWFREDATRPQRAAVSQQVARAARALPEQEALALFGLTPAATAEEFRSASRAVLHRWHPDRAPHEAARAEYHVRFCAYSAARERLLEAYEAGTLPADPPPSQGGDGGG